MQVGDFLARCELFISADPDIEENDAIASAGAEAVAYACNGSIAEAEVTVTARAVARALARAVAQADVFCETVGGEDTIACGLSEANVRAVARAQVRFVQGTNSSLLWPALVELASQECIHTQRTCQDACGSHPCKSATLPPVHALCA